MNYEHYMATNTYKRSAKRNVCENCEQPRKEHTGPHEFCPAIVVTSLAPPSREAGKEK